MDLNNKKILFLGSSVTHGSAAGGTSFADIMSERCGVIAFKEAVPGTTLADINEMSYVSRLKAFDKNTKIDLFVCQLSTNDASQGVDPCKIEAAIRFILSYVKETFDCPMAFYTGTYFESAAYEAMIDMLYRLQAEYEFEILDMFNDSEMRSVSADDYRRYMSDPIHPNLLGYTEWWTPKFITFCEGIS